MNPRLLISAISLLSAIAAGLVATGDRPVATARANVAAPPAKPQPTQPNRPTQQIAPSEQTRIVWNYRYDPDILPDLRWLQMEPGVTYRLVDQDGICLGRAQDGAIDLVHFAPSVCGLPGSTAAQPAGGEG